VSEVTAIEPLAEVLALASADAPPNVRFETGDVHALAYADGTFDVVHAHQVLQHVADPVQALREMRRVARPGGIVAVRDSDYRAFAWYPELPGLDAWLALYLRVARHNAGQPDAGRKLLSWAQQAGFTDITATTSTWCFATPEDRAWWGGMWADRILHSAIAGQAVTAGFATRQDLERISAEWLTWAEAPDGWMSLLHGELICRVLRSTGQYTLSSAHPTRPSPSAVVTTPTRPEPAPSTSNSTIWNAADAAPVSPMTSAVLDSTGTLPRTSATAARSAVPRGPAAASGATANTSSRDTAARLRARRRPSASASRIPPRSAQMPNSTASTPASAFRPAGHASADSSRNIAHPSPGGLPPPALVRADSRAARSSESSSTAPQMTACAWPLRCSLRA
jgi:SAM-dependent methyltransferase